MRSRVIFLGIFLLLGVCVLLASVFMVAGQESIASITVDQLVDDINAGRVTKIEVSDSNQLTVTMRGDDTHYETQLNPSTDDPMGTLISLGADPDTVAQVDFEFRRPNHDFTILGLLGTLMPLITVALVLVGLGWLIGRRSSDPRKRKPKLKNDWT